MYRGYKSHIIAICFLFPKNRTNKIFLTKNLIAYFFEVVYLIIINGNKNNTVITQKISRQSQTRIHHIQPVCVIPSHSFRIAFCGLLRNLFISCNRVGEIIIIYKIVAGVVRRVYKDAVFDTNRKSLLRHISAEKGLK